MVPRPVNDGYVGARFPSLWKHCSAGLCSSFRQRLSFLLTFFFLFFKLPFLKWSRYHGFGYFPSWTYFLIVKFSRVSLSLLINKCFPASIIETHTFPSLCIWQRDISASWSIALCIRPLMWAWGQAHMANSHHGEMALISGWQAGLFEDGAGLILPSWKDMSCLVFSHNKPALVLTHHAFSPDSTHTTNAQCQSSSCPHVKTPKQECNLPSHMHVTKPWHEAWRLSYRKLNFHSPVCKQ